MLLSSLLLLLSEFITREVIIIKKMILFLIGFIPLILGFLMNSWLMENQDSVLPFKLIGLLFLAFWVTVGFMSYKFEITLLKSSVVAHLPALLMLLFIMYQEIILGQYWSNLFGTATQFYYLPLINVSSSLVGVFWSSSKGLWLACLIAFLFMLASYYLGNYFKKRSAVYSNQHLKEFRTFNFYK